MRILHIQKLYKNIVIRVNVARDLLENCDTIKNAHDTRSLVNKKKNILAGVPQPKFAKLIHGHVFRDTDNKFFINSFKFAKISSTYPTRKKI